MRRAGPRAPRRRRRRPCRTSQCASLVVALPTCGVSTTLGASRSPAADVRLVVEDVEPRPAEASRDERVDEGRLVEHRAPRRVDDDRPLPAAGPVGARSRRWRVAAVSGTCRLTASEVREELVEVRDVARPRRCRAVRGGGRCISKAAARSADLAADAAVADEPEAHAREVAAERRRRARSLPTLRAAALDAPSRSRRHDREEERHREVRRRGVEHARACCRPSRHGVARRRGRRCRRRPRRWRRPRAWVTPASKTCSSIVSFRRQMSASAPRDALAELLVAGWAVLESSSTS